MPVHYNDSQRDLLWAVNLLGMFSEKFIIKTIKKSRDTHFF
jgi:hypothetical protein